MTARERVVSLHARMEARQRERERRKTSALGAACVVLAACLLVLVFGGPAAHCGGAAGMYSGAIMLFGNAGAYVLTALIAFAAGSLATLLGLRHRNSTAGNGSEEKHTSGLEENSDEAAHADGHGGQERGTRL